MAERMAKDLELTVTVRNNQIKSRRVAMLLSQKDLAKATGLPLNTVCGYESLREQPTRALRDYRCKAPGCLKNYAIKVSRSFCADHFLCSPKDRETWEREYRRPDIVVWRRSAAALATFFSVAPEVLFPEAIKAVQKPRIVSTVDVPELMTALGIVGSEDRFALMPENLETEERGIAVAEALGSLSEKEKRLITARFFDDKTLKVAGREIGVGQERARQIEQRALRKLRHPRSSNRLKEVL